MTLEECRSGINRINREMLRLFCERMELSAEVAAYKKEKGLPILDPAREREILAEVSACVPSELSAYAKSFFASTMEISRAYQSRLIAPRGTISREFLESRAKTPSESPKNAEAACRGNEDAACSGTGRISLMLTLPHTPGTLCAVISKLAIGGCNLLRIESRPIEGSDFEFRFYLDFEAPSEEIAASVLDDLENSVGGIGYLGCYAEL